MDRYLFRGKRTDNGEWIEGFVHLCTDNYTPKNVTYVTTYKELDNGEIILSECHDVDPKTVGQYTGLIDKDGKRIFEGDIFRTGVDIIASVEWEKEGRFLGFTHDRQIVYINREPAVEVIGSIHDNPELLQEVKNNDISS